MWRALLDALIEQAQLPIDADRASAALPIADLWARGDKAAVFMCGLPFSRAEPQPVPIAAPVPSPTEFGGEPRYWSDLVVRADSAFRELRDTFGHRIAFTSPDSQSGYGAALTYFTERRAIGIRSSAKLLHRKSRPSARSPRCSTEPPRWRRSTRMHCGLLQRYRPELTSQVRIVAKTAPRPIPLLVASHGGLEPLQNAFLEAHRNRLHQDPDG